MVKLRRISLIESYILESKDLTLEAKKDLEDLKDYLGDDLFDDYMKIRDRIPKDKNDFKDFSKLKKMDLKDIRDFVSSFQSKSDKKKQDKSEGAKKLYEDDEWVVYKITTYPAAQLYGKGTKWCITGRYPGHEGKGQEYFNDYIEDNNLDGGYYFYLNKKDPSEKYCVLQTRGKKIHSIWDAGDSDLGTSMVEAGVVLPLVDNVNLKKPTKKELLYIYIINKDIKKIEDLLSKKINLNSESFQPPILEEAISYGDKEIVELLLKHGANPNIKNTKGYTPLYVSCNSYDENKEIVELLLKYGADPNIYTNSFNTPILVASSHGHKEIVDLLLRYGANINDTDTRGNTPLMLSCIRGDFDLAEFLLKEGAKVDVKNFDGDTPLLLASKYKRIVDLLKKYGAKE